MGRYISKNVNSTGDTGLFLFSDFIIRTIRIREWQEMIFDWTKKGEKKQGKFTHMSVPNNDPSLQQEQSLNTKGSTIIYVLFDQLWYWKKITTVEQWFSLVLILHLHNLKWKRRRENHIIIPPPLNNCYLIDKFSTV